MYTQDLIKPTSRIPINRHIALPRYEPNYYVKPQKILICAPSNAAIDQIIRLVLEKGILNNEGLKSQPSLVRIGPNYHESLKEVSLEHLVATEMGTDPNKVFAEVRNMVNGLIITRY